MSRRAPLAGIALTLAVFVAGCGDGGSRASNTNADRAPVGVALELSSSGGSQPTLTWRPVTGATTYSVTVQQRDGRVFWGWQGGETSVVVGDGAPDPLVDETMTWSVVAYDDEGNALWISPQGAIT